MDTHESWSGIERLELQRRMDIVAACVTSSAAVTPKLFDAQENLRKYKDSKLIHWAVGLAITLALAGHYVWDGLYAPMVIAISAVATRMFDHHTQRATVQRQTEQLGIVRMLWLTGGHVERVFDSLIEMMRSADFNLDSEAYRKWWDTVHTDAARRVSSALRN